jgi:hypothetical protein
MARTVFHVSDADDLSAAAAKVRNLVAADDVPVEDVRVVLDRPGVIDALADTDPGREALDGVRTAGGTVCACRNALRGASTPPEDLPPGVERVSSAVGELTRLQTAGYAYIRL